VDSSEWSLEEEIADCGIGRPHLVLLGAGASLAAFPNGDANGRRLPLMNTLVDVLELAHILSAADLPIRGNFEEIYASIHDDPAAQRFEQK
jgi:hypothetical protein